MTRFSGKSESSGNRKKTNGLDAGERRITGRKKKENWWGCLKTAENELQNPRWSWFLLPCRSRIRLILFIQIASHYLLINNKLSFIFTWMQALRLSYREMEKTAKPNWEYRSWKMVPDDEIKISHRWISDKKNRHKAGFCQTCKKNDYGRRIRLVNRAENSLPLPGSDSISSCASWRKSAWRTMARPRPVPLSFRERLLSTR